MQEMCNGANLRLNCSTPLDHPSAPGLAAATMNSYLRPWASFNFSTSGLIPLEEESRR